MTLTAVGGDVTDCGCHVEGAQPRLTRLTLADQLLDRARQRRVEVDQLGPRRGHDDADHAVVERADLGLPLDPLFGRHLVAGVHLEVLVGDAVDDVQLGSTADEQDLGRVHFGVDGQGHDRVGAQRLELRRVLRGAHDDLGAVPCEADRDVAGCAVLGDVGEPGDVAGQQLLADRSAQDLGDLVRLHGQTRLLGGIRRFGLVHIWDDAAGPFSTRQAKFHDRAHSLGRR